MMFGLFRNINLVGTAVNVIFLLSGNRSPVAVLLRAPDAFITPKLNFIQYIVETIEQSFAF